MNVEALLQVKEQILKNPLGFDMEDWFCDTTMCIGGFLVTNAGWSEIHHKSYKCRHEIFGDLRISDVACEILEIHYDQGLRLLYYANWPPAYRAAYEEAKRTGDSLAMAKVAAKRIDLFIIEMKEAEDERGCLETCAVV